MAGTWDVGDPFVSVTGAPREDATPLREGQSA